MKKILLLTNTASMILQFNMRNIEILTKTNYEVCVACNFVSGCTCSPELVEELKDDLNKKKVRFFQIDFERNLRNFFSLVTVWKQIKKILKQENFDVIFCQSTIAGLLGRLLGVKFGCKVIYMVHGFQFYKGASKLRWGVFYTLEKILSKKTDLLLLTNREDYEIANKKFFSKKTVYVPGVGVDIDSFKRNEIEGDKIRKELNISSNDYVIFSAGELSERKNLRSVLHVIKLLNNPKIKYIICGIGVLEQEFITFIEKNNLQNQVFLLGYRKDLCNIFSAANLFVFPSFYEGLPVSLMMAISTKTPVICSRIRGNTDLIQNDLYMFDPNNEKMIKDKILMAMESNNSLVVEENYKWLQNFSAQKVDELMKKLFLDI